jgi:O-antigen/teichoic acid export membrane protein
VAGRRLRGCSPTDDHEGASGRGYTPAGGAAARAASSVSHPAPSTAGKRRAQISRIPTRAGLGGLASSVAGYALATAFTGLVGLAVVPAYTRTLGTTAYGEFQAAAAVFTLATGLLMLGLDSAIAVLMPDHVSVGQRKRLVSSLLAIAALSGAAATLILLVGGPIVGPGLLGAAPGGLLVLGALVVGPSIVQNVAQASLRNLARASAYLATAIASGVGVLLVGLPLVVVRHAGPAGAVAGLAAGAIFGAAMATWSQRDLLARGAIDRQRLTALLHIGLPLLPAAVAAWIVSVSDRLLLTHLATLSDVGLYSAAAQIATVPNLAISAFMLGWLPFALRVQHAPEAPRLYGTSLSLFVAAGAVATLLAVPLGEPVLAFISGPAFAPGGTVIWLLVGSAFAYGGYVMLNVGVMVARRTALISAVTAIAAAVNVVVNLALIPPLGFLGAGIATLAAYLASSGSLYVLGQRTLRIPYEPGYVILLLAGTLGAASIAAATPSAALRWLIVVVASLAVVGSALPRLRRFARLAQTADAAARSREEAARAVEEAGPSSGEGTGPP